MVLSTKRAYSDLGEKYPGRVSSCLNRKKRSLILSQSRALDVPFGSFKVDGRSLLSSTGFYLVSTPPTADGVVPCKNVSDSDSCSSMVAMVTDAALSNDDNKTTALPPVSPSFEQAVPRCDVVARERCFDYILQCIDEVWGRYCDITSNAEAMVYDGPRLPCMTRKQPSSGVSLLSPTSCPVLADRSKQLVTSKADDSSSSSSSSSTDYSDDGQDEDAKSETTNLTEYETDNSDNRTVSNLPDSIKLQSLKFRLTKAKNDLELCYDSLDYEDCVRFWRRWDMIKYNAVEMMEEEDDDEIIENAIGELEAGRYFHD